MTKGCPCNAGALFYAYRETCTTYTTCTHESRACLSEPQDTHTHPLGGCACVCLCVCVTWPSDQVPFRGQPAGDSSPRSGPPLCHSPQLARVRVGRAIHLCVHELVQGLQNLVPEFVLAVPLQGGPVNFVRFQHVSINRPGDTCADHPASHKP